MICVDCEGEAMHVVELPLEHDERRPQINADALLGGDIGGRSTDTLDPCSAGDGNIYIVDY